MPRSKEPMLGKDAEMALEECALHEMQALFDDAEVRDEISVASIYRAMAALEERQADLRLRRRTLGDEIRRRSALQQMEAKLSAFSPAERAELAKLARDQTVALRQG